jgi:putative isomerase
MSSTWEEIIGKTIKNAFADTLKEASGGLQHPYISPGGVYSVDLWDWDSYWTAYAMLGMANKFQDRELYGKIKPYARGVLFNFLEHAGEDGSLPIMMSPTDDDWFDSRLSPENNMAKPFIAQLAQLLMVHDVIDANELIELFYVIRDFHACYRRRFLHPETGLVCWGSDLGIGVDDDPTVWGRPRRSCGSIFLNTFLYRDYLAAAEISTSVGRSDYAAEYRELADGLKTAIQKYCWDSREKAFFSVDQQCRQNLYPHRYWGTLNRKLTPFWQCLKLKVLSWSAILPLWAGIADQSQIADFIREHFVPERLMSSFGIRSLSADEPMYAPEVARGNPSNWLGPIWLLPNYLTYEMLSANGYVALASELAEKIKLLLATDLKSTGTLHEYYSPESGRGVCTPGFMSWNSLAGLM